MQSEICSCNILTRWRVSVVDVSPMGSCSSVCPEETGDSTLTFIDGRREVRDWWIAPGAKYDICDGIWIEVFWGARRTRSPRMFGCTGSTASTRHDGVVWRSETTAWQWRLQQRSFPPVVNETNDVADLIVCYVIDEALLMCDWLHVYMVPC